MRRVRTLPIFAAIIAGIVLVTGLMLLEVRLPDVGGNNAVTLTDADPLLSSHQRLLSISAEYKVRLESMDSMLQSGLVKRAAISGEDVVVSSTARLLREHGGPLEAAKAAAAELSRAAAELSSQAARIGFDVGPRMLPAHIRARIRDEQAQTEFAQLVFAFQTLACSDELLRAMQPASAP